MTRRIPLVIDLGPWEHCFVHSTFASPRQLTGPNVKIWKAKVQELMLGVATNHFEVRNPEFKKDHSITQWHYDGYRDEQWCWLLLWSNIWPTELKAAGNNHRYNRQAGHIYLVNNKKVLHRTPPQAINCAEPRWFARAVIENASWHP